jgi:hypothetical protein
MSLYPTKTRVQLLRDIDAGNVITDFWEGMTRIVLDDPEAGDLRTVTARVQELERAGWCERHEFGPSWRLTDTGRAIAYPKAVA